MSRYRLWQLLPKFPLELFDEFALIGKYEHLPLFNEAIAKELCRRFRHYNGLTQSGCENNLALSGFPKCGQESLYALILIVP